MVESENISFKIPLMERRGGILIYPWSVSSSGIWNPQKELTSLRDCTPKELIKALSECDDVLQISAIEELLSHGNQRKAAEVARGLVTANPEIEDFFLECFGDDRGEYLLDTPLNYMPSRPKDYPKDTDIEYVQ